MKRFWKYHGIGNDFVIVDNRQGLERTTPQEAIAWCDRHRGIGADGILVIERMGGADGRMVVLNSDGSEAGMCGNGLRCVAKFLGDHGGAKSPFLNIWVGDEVYRCQRLEEELITVDMGPAKLVADHLPTADDGDMALSLEVSGQTFSGHRLSMGNPHFVIKVDADRLAETAEKFGDLLSNHSAFVDRANVSFYAVGDDEVKTVVFERGVGFTQACGSAACAVGYVLLSKNSWPATVVPVSLPGGVLQIALENGRIQMTGPAQSVFEGTLP